jgi:hypothetical protein
MAHRHEVNASNRKNELSEYRYRYPYRREPSELPEKFYKRLGETPPVNSEIDNKNRADITVGPVVKN